VAAYGKSSKTRAGTILNIMRNLLSHKQLPPSGCDEAAVILVVEDDLLVQLWLKIHRRRY
jgi:hypothetical protein